MFDLIISIAITLLGFLAMEAMAWFSHKYIMHGILWTLHKDHHTPSKEHVFQKNDFFFLLFASPGIACLAYGLAYDSFLFWIGLGITLYGFTYFLVHDIIIHRRIKGFNTPEWPYVKAIRKAHKIHHKQTEKHHGSCFGMLVVPRKYYVEAHRISK